MAAVLFNPFYFSIDGNGVPRAGATYSFFQTGTSTPQNTFTDSTLVTPNANPVVADSNGLFPPIYLSASFDYKVILKDSAGVTIATRDPIGYVPTAFASTFPLVRAALSGLALSAAGGTGTFGVAAGTAADSTNVLMMNLASSITKTTSAWAVGNGSGSLDTGAIAASTWYHAFEIQRTDTGVVEVLTSLSPTTPTMPANYTLFRRIGSMLTDGSKHWTAFTQIGDDFLWVTPVGSDISDGTLTTSLKTYTLAGVPTGAQVKAYVTGYIACANGVFLSVTPLSTTGATATNSRMSVNTAGANAPQAVIFVWTNTSAQIQAISSGASTSFNLDTLGWNDPRGKNG